MMRIRKMLYEAEEQMRKTGMHHTRETVMMRKQRERSKQVRNQGRNAHHYVLSILLT